MTGTGKKAPATAAGTLVREVTILNKFGIHARPAALFVKTANQFAADVQVDNNGFTVSAKSIMGLLTLEGYQGVLLRLTATGPDALQALDALEELVKSKFYEE